ncbi:MAG: DUF1559 family PulG-like putative transporter [Pirellulales bacterium]
MNQPSADNPTQFKIIHLMYISAMLSSALALFGPSGIVYAMLVCFFWIPIFLSHNRPRIFIGVVTIYLLSGCLLSLLMPTIQDKRHAPTRFWCMNNMKHLGIALHNYHDTYDSFPPAYVADANGKPMHSWRVLLLPYLDENKLYNQYDLKEPWDGPSNSKLATSMPDVFACPEYQHQHQGHNHCTSYVAVTGRNSIWNGEKATTFADITDGTSSTLLLTECDEQRIPWMQPSDLEYDESIETLASSDSDTFTGHRDENFFFKLYTGRVLLFADGSTRFSDFGISKQTWAALIGIDDQIGLTAADLEAKPGTIKRIRIGNWFRLGIFLFLTVFPLPWVWIDPSSKEQVKAPFA